MNTKIIKGQRWISETEPELGLGIVEGVDKRFMDISFPAQNLVRRYSQYDPPLRRIIFKPGDTIHDAQGIPLKISSVEEGADGILNYRCGLVSVSETSLSDTLSSLTPLRRFSLGLIDSMETFNLRASLLQFHADILKSPVRGYVGGRIDLLPHQLFIADAITSRRVIRSLLADEIGLGKTIEACLVMHRLLETGKIRRVLILVPPHLIHQWFVELLRRFNLTFRIYSSEYLADFAPGDNPFLSDQLGICNRALLESDSVLRDFSINADWDLVIVDEAHHLQQNTPAYDFIQQLSERVKGLLLLTATPEQMGQEAHFARLHLLDPERYANFGDYKKELGMFQRVYEFIHTALEEMEKNSQNSFSPEHKFEVPGSLLDAVSGIEAMDSTAQSLFLTLNQIIDYLGTGRIMFRNTRRNISGFPKRLVHLAPLAGNSQSREECINEFLADAGIGSMPVVIKKDDPRVSWLKEMIENNQDEKILIICSKKEKVLALQEAIKSRRKIDIAIFHEEMSILQRDRNAAWFSEEQGASLLISSEIGSEGRNFQFCHHLVLFDLPINPELLEQRIGRLDRIGQRENIHLHIPFVENTIQEVVCRWYHEGLDCFQQNVPAAGWVYEIMRPRIMALCNSVKIVTSERETLIRDTRQKCRELSDLHLNARDKLFELHSFDPRKSKEIIDEIQALDMESRSEAIVMSLFRYYGVEIEDAGAKKFALITHYVTDPDFPLPRNERPVITFDRKTAVNREEIEFVTIDHPMLKDALDLFLSSEQGTAAFGYLPDKSGENELIIELLFVAECIAPPHLGVNRFLPPTPLRFVINRENSDVTEDYPPERLTDLRNLQASELSSGYEDLSEFLHGMIEAGSLIAEEKVKLLITKAMDSMRTLLEKEKARLCFLSQQKFLTIKDSQKSCEAEQSALEKCLKLSRIRLDSMRVIKKGGLKEK